MWQQAVVQKLIRNEKYMYMLVYIVFHILLFVIQSGDGKNVVGHHCSNVSQSSAIQRCSEIIRTQFSLKPYLVTWIIRVMPIKKITRISYPIILNVLAFNIQISNYYLSLCERSQIINKIHILSIEIGRTIYESAVQTIRHMPHVANGFFKCGNWLYLLIFQSWNVLNKIRMFF